LIETAAFEIAGLTWTHHEKGVAVFNVQGVITNKTQSERAAPKVRIALRDDAGKEIFHWTVVPVAARLSVSRTPVGRWSAFAMSPDCRGTPSK
jgi:cobyrinic acid a,c-diamide synthase